MRKSYDELKEIMSKYKVSRIWSWSKWNTFHNSMYEYYLKYIAHAKEDRADSIYTTTGGISHSILESLYNGEIKKEDMISQFEDGWTTAFNIAELKFDRNNEEHNQKIADKYYKNLKHFFENHTIITNKVVIEQFITAMIGDNLFHGYIDCCFKDEDNCFNIIDFKTSSIYTGKKAENEAGQLVTYAIGLNQKGVPFDKIKIAWNFLKYVSVKYTQANGEVKTRNVERCEIGEKLQSNAKVWLKKYGHNIDYYLKLLLDTNDISCLPEDVQAMYEIKDCYVYIDLTDNLLNRWKTDIINTIKDIENREKDYEELKNKNIAEEKCAKAFWDSDESVSANSYYYSTLCSYSPNLILPYKAYLDRIEKNKNNEDMFCGLNKSDDEIDVVSNSVSCKESDLSWLNDL